MSYNNNSNSGPQQYGNEIYRSFGATAGTGGGYMPATASMRDVMKSVYLKMTLGMLVTALFSMFTLFYYPVLEFTFNMRWILLIAEVLLVVYLTARLDRMSATAATGLFFGFAALNGVTLAPICLAYTGASIAKTFFITAGVFGAMSVYGYFTTRDLTRWGTLLVFALIGLLIAVVVNMFAHSSTLDLLISCAGVLIFIGLTAWDTQKIKLIAAQSPAGTESKVATIGALSLYLDFINLFLYLLRFFGRRE